MVAADDQPGLSHVSARALGATLVAILASGLAASGRAATIDASSCSAPGGLAEELVEPSDLAVRCAEDASCWRTGLEQARAVRDRHPESYDAHRAFVLLTRAAARALGPEPVRAAAAEYEALARQNAGNPAYRHLLAQLTLDGTAYREELEGLVREFPDYPWAALSLVYQTAPDAPGDQRASARAALVRFTARCPERVAERVRGLERLGESSPLLAEQAELRASALNRGDADTMVRVWSLLLRLAPKERQEELRRAVASDVRELAAAPAGGTLAGLRAQVRGSDLAGDRDGRLRAEGALLTAFPCADEASRFRLERWREAHPRPRGEEASARAAWRAAYLADVDRALALCPADELALRRRIQLLADAPAGDDRDLFTTVDRLLALHHRHAGGSPSDAGWVAGICLDRGARLERVPELLKADREDARASRDRALRAGDPDAEARFAWRERENLRLQVRLALAVRDVAEARSRLDQLTAATASAPGGGRLPPASGISVFPDERTALDQLTARVAVAEGRPEAALARLVPLLPDEQLGPEVEADARLAWRAQRGSEDGFEAWRASLAQGQTSAGWRAVDRPVPAVPLSEFGGGEWRWENFRGKTLVVGVWATWCLPCREELPWISRLGERLSERGDVTVVTINADRSNAGMLPFLSESGLDLPVLVGGDGLFEEGLTGLPTVWVVSPEGRIVRELTGFSGPGEEWLTAAQREVEAVAGPAPPPGLAVPPPGG